MLAYSLDVSFYLVALKFKKQTKNLTSSFFIEIGWCFPRDAFYSTEALFSENPLTSHVGIKVFFLPGYVRTLLLK